MTRFNLKFTLVIRYLILFIILYFYSLNTKAASPPIPVTSHKLRGAIFNELIKWIDKANGADLKKITDASTKLNEGFSNANTSLTKIETQLKTDAFSVKQWRATTTPFPDPYEAIVSPIKATLKIHQETSKGLLKSLELNNFNNLSTPTNTGTVLADTISASLFDNMCPKSSALKKMPGIDTYADLKESSCTSIYNLIAYKKKATDDHLQSLSLLEKATFALMNVPELPIPTIGRHNAKKTALLELETLQQEERDDYNLRMKNADIQIAIETDTMNYAAESIAEGPPVSKSVAAIAAVTKLAIGTAISTAVVKNVPYNE